MRRTDASSPLGGSSWFDGSLYRFSARFERRVLRSVDVAADERHHIRWPGYASEAFIEDQPGDGRGGLDLGLENVSLQRVQQTLSEQCRRNLFRHGLGSLDEHLVGDPRRLRRKDRHSDGWKDIKVVRLSGQ